MCESLFIWLHRHKLSTSARPLNQNILVITFLWQGEKADGKSFQHSNEQTFCFVLWCYSPTTALPIFATILLSKKLILRCPAFPGFLFKWKLIRPAAYNIDTTTAVHWHWLSLLSPPLAAEAKEAAGEPGPGAQVSRQRAARGDFGEPQTTHR